MRALFAVALSVGVLVASTPAVGLLVSTPPADQPADPSGDPLGWESGYWHNESIAVDQTDGLNESELEAFVSRGMARVEFIRNREFRSDVPVNVMSREAYRNQTSSNTTTQSAFARWNNQVWEGLWIVGEDTNAQSALSSTSGSAVAGFYSPSRDEIMIITPNTSQPTISNATLIHELVHALQDQYIDLSDPKYYRGVDGTQDASLAVSGLIEGEANYVETEYSTRCGGAWSCVPTPDTGSGGGGASDINYGIYLTIFHPYSDGPVWVNDIIDQGGWDALTARYQDIPVSTEQIIHRTTEDPAPIEFTDSGTNGWSTYPNQGVDGADTVGEASIFAMFWYQSRNYNAGIVDWQAIAADGKYDAYDYASAPSSGWGNDLLVPYQKGSGEDAAAGYVWKTVWDTERDATQFKEAYLQILQTHDAMRYGPNTYVVERQPFADAFHVVQDGTTVTIVNGPNVSALTDIRPSITIDQYQTTTTTTTTQTTTTQTTKTTTTTATTTESTTATTEPTTTTSGATGPGLGLAITVTAILVAIVLARGRR
ncbi:MAG: Hvo_1808 family surface protein [Halobacteriaceae archaeon]